MAERREDGALETEVLSYLWQNQGGATPSDVREGMGTDLAYTTVMTILSRLWQKGLVTRTRVGRAFAYSPVVTEGELAARRMRALFQGIRDREGALSHFVSSLGKRDEATLRRLLNELEGPA